MLAVKEEVVVSPLKNSSQQITAMDLVQELKAEGVAAAATAATLGQEKRALADMFENEDLSSLVKQEEAQEALEDRMDVTGDNPPPPPPSAAATATSTPASANPGLNAATVAASGASAVEGADFNELLKVFYARLFPFKLFHKWLAYGSIQKNYFAHREFSFTLPNDAYLRFHSYSDAESFKTDVMRLNPVKIDIGAVYNTNPKNRKQVQQGNFVPLERELVFDIDMTDYDEVRTCCSGGDICKKCWKFMTISIKVLDRVLREDFGFKHLLWIYSGRRGVHCWISDERARKMTAEARKAIVGYLEVVKGGESMGRKVNLPRNANQVLHPSLSKAEQTLNKYFPSILSDQDILSSRPHFDKLMQLIPDDEIKRRVGGYIFSEAGEKLSSTEKWEVLASEVMAERKKKSALGTSLRDIVFQYTYPRLDDHVTTGLNHLLKSPFCVHPKTGRVCVPIDPEKADSFSPFTVPTLTLLVQELSSTAKSVEETSLGPYLVYFKKWLMGIELGIREQEREKRAEQDREKMLMF